MPLLTSSAKDAFGSLRRNKVAKWPDGRRDTHRLSGVAEVDFRPSFEFQAGEPILTIGSCFARNIETRLASAGFEVPALTLSLPEEERSSDTDNDLLNKYTPHSILNELRWALQPKMVFPQAALLQVGQNAWHDPHIAANVAPATLERVLERRAMVTALFAEARRCRVIVITLGLTEAWFDTNTSLYLNGPPPLRAIAREPDRFRFEMLSPADVLEALENIHTLLQAGGRSDFRIVLTVSPVPMKVTFSGKDAITANTYSKSALRAAAEAFVLAHENVDYFPSYEIVTQTPRAAAYIQDNRHVTTSLIDEIASRVISAYHPDAAEDNKSPIHLKDVEKTLKHGDPIAVLYVLGRLKDGKRYAEIGWSAAHFHLTYGKALARSGSLARAQVELEKAARLDPQSWSAAYNLGIALNKLQRPIEAEAEIRRAVQLSPQSIEMRLRLVRQLISNRAFDEANRELSIAADAGADGGALSDVVKELILAQQAAKRAQVAKTSETVITV